MLCRIASALSMVAVTGASWGDVAPKTDPPKPLKLVQLSRAPSDTRVLLATLKLAKRLRDDGNDVVIFADLDASVIGDRTLRHVPAAQRDKVHRQLDTIVAAGIPVLVCPHCAKRFELGEDSLRKGATMTSRDELDALKDRADQIFEFREPSTSRPTDDDSQVHFFSLNLQKGARS